MLMSRGRAQLSITPIRAGISCLREPLLFTLRAWPSGTVTLVRYTVVDTVSVSGLASKAQGWYIHGCPVLRIHNPCLHVKALSLCQDPHTVCINKVINYV